MATAASKVAEDGLDANVRVFLRDLKGLLNQEKRSSTKIRSFNRLLRRVPDTAAFAQCKFEFSMKQINSNKKLFVDSIIFVKDIPWSIHMEPHNMFGSSPSYDVVIKCYFPGALCQEDSEIFANIRFNGPSPISTVTKTQYFRQSQKMFVLPDCISHNKLKNAKTNKRSMFEFTVSIEIKTDKRKRHENKLPSARSQANSEHWGYMTEHMTSPRLPPTKKLPSPNALIALSALYNLLSEETMRLSTGETWFKMLDFVGGILTRYWWKNSSSSGKGDSAQELQQFMCQTGLVDHLIFLLEADFTEGVWSALVPGLLVRLITWRTWELAKSHQQKQFERLTKTSQILMDKVKQRRSGARLISRIVLNVLPSLYNLGTGKERVVKFVDCLADLNEYYNVKNTLQLARKLDTATLAECYRATFQSCDVVSDFYHFYHKMVLSIITSNKLQALPIETAKSFLRTIGENKINPYFDSGSQAFTINNITRLLFKHTKADLSGYWLNWIGDNACFNPLLFDLVPAEISYEVPFTTECGCLDYEPLDIPHLMPLYLRIYNKYFNMVMKPLRTAIYHKEITCSIAAIEKIKNQGNLLHKSREFDLALGDYDKAIDMLMVRKLRCREFEDDSEYMYNTENLLTVCRSNRVSSNLELGRNEDAIVDATLALRELHGLIEGDEQNYWECIEREKDEEILIKREVATRFKRVKALSNLKQWGPALQNVLPVIRNEQYRDLAMGYYYNCLIMYIKEHKNMQYPTFCVMCCTTETEDDKTFHQLLKRCSKCKHPYCSSTCKTKDKPNHSKYCEHLTKLYKRLGSGTLPVLTNSPVGPASAM